MPPGPFDHPGATVRGEHGAGRVLVGGGQHDRVHSGAIEPCDLEPVLVDTDRHDLKPRPLDRAVYGRRARVLDGDPPGAMGAQRLAQEAQRVRRRGGDEHLLGITHHRAHSPQILTQGDAQLAQPARRPVPKRGIRQVTHRV